MCWQAQRRPRILVLHGETLYFGGAQKMLAYFAQGARQAGLEVVVGMAPNPAMRAALPAGQATAELPANQRFGLGPLIRQARRAAAAARANDADILHGWTSRDWELTSLAGRLAGRPRIGLLHDHPLARGISGPRRRLMKLCATLGLNRVLCVSHAVETACRAAGYPSRKLVTIHNGIPCLTDSGPTEPPPSLIRLGFIGVFTERKGLRLLFELIDCMSRHTRATWELRIAGEAQDEAGRGLVNELQERYGGRSWWSCIKWQGWIAAPRGFLQGLDLLIVPSSEFDPFPTVLLEAGAARRAVFGARVGGVPEIVEPGITGWMFEPGDVDDAGRTLARLLETPAALSSAGQAAARRVRERFSIERMVADYLELYGSLCDHRRADQPA